MKFNIVTIFPDLIDSFCNIAFIHTAITKKLIRIEPINLRNFSEDKHNRVDDKVYGGGPGMVLKYEPIKKAILSLKNKGKVIYLTPQGKPLSQKKLKSLSNLDNLTILCGRYEGVDERIIREFVDEEISLGDYVISGGEIASMVIIEGITRLLPGVVDDYESINQDSFQKGILDFPHYTRPDNVDNHPIPEVLLSGNHIEIKKWRRKQSLGATWHKRPELLKNVKLSEEDDKLLKEYISEFKENGHK
jgi:tRNA (guanine37-N1)-methyltransferase